MQKKLASHFYFCCVFLRRRNGFEINVVGLNLKTSDVMKNGILVSQVVREIEQPLEEF